MDSEELAILEEFKEKFKKLKELGFSDSRRFHDTGIGKTAEDLLDIAENNKSHADYKGLIELKSHRELSEAMVTLFTKSPDPRGTNTIIRNTYGYFDEKFTEKKVLHVTFSAKQFNSSEKGNYGFRLDIDEAAKKIFVRIKNLKSNKLEDSVTAYYAFDDLRDKIEHKCKYIVFITAEKKKNGQKELFNFTTAKLLSGLTFDKFLEFLNKGLIKYDFRLGIYKSGKNEGKYHDHGSGFRFTPGDMGEIFTITNL